MQQLTRFHSADLRIDASFLLEDQQIRFSFKKEPQAYWHQEDVKSFYESLFSLVENIVIKEVISGADRENIRFLWQQRYDFVLNFDCYSQSCWLEAENEFSERQLLALHTAWVNKE